MRALRSKKSAVELLLLALFVVSLLFTPTTSAKAQSQVFEFPLGRGSTDYGVKYTENLNLILGNLGDGNSWVIPAKSRVYFNSAVGSLNIGHALTNWVGQTIYGVGACDIATWFYYVANQSGVLKAGTSSGTLDHPAIAGVPLPNGVTIYQPGQDMWIENPTNEDIVIRWTADSDNVKIWIEKDGWSISLPEISSPSLTIEDQSQEALGIFGKSSCTERTSTSWIVWHQIVAGDKNWDGLRLAQYFKNNRGWDIPGYTYLLDANPLPDGTVKIWQLWPENCGTYGVGENYNFAGIHIAYVDVPAGAPPSDEQLNTLKLLTSQLMQQHGVTADHVVSHTETGLASRGGQGWTQEMRSQWAVMLDNNGKPHDWSPSKMEIPAACDNLNDANCVSILNNPHSDPVGVNMNIVRAELGSGIQIYVGPNRPSSNGWGSIAKAIGFATPCIIMIIVIMVLGSWLRSNPSVNSRQLLRTTAGVTDWQMRRHMRGQLRKTQQSHGLIGIGFPTIMAVILIASGLQLTTTGKEASSCNFVPILSDHNDGSWAYGVVTDYQDFHTGSDKMGKQGEPIPASADGKIVWASWWPGDPMWEKQNIGHGNTVVVETSCNGKSWYHFYAHLSEIDVKVGQKVNQGDIIGLMGDTGASTNVHLHFAISELGPTEEHGFEDWVNPNSFISKHNAPLESPDFTAFLKVVGLQVTGWSFVVLAVLVIFFFGESQGILGLIRQSTLPAFFFAGLVLFMQVAPMLSVIKLDWTYATKLAYTRMTSGSDLDLFMPILPPPSFQGAGSTSESMLDIPASFAAEVRELGPQVIQIAMEEDVPPETLFVLWLKESGGRRTNPANGEGLCGFYSRVKGGRDYFTPGAISTEEVLRQLRECAKEFHAHNNTGTPVTFETSDFDILGQIYMAYNGNIDCHGNPFASWKDHPYVMNGFDDANKGMIARDGNGGCVALKIIGAVPAHIQIAKDLRGK